MTNILTPLLVTLTDGSRVKIEERLVLEGRFRGLNEYGDWVITDSCTPDDETYLIPLTPCCHATAKGSMGAIVCRACYEEINPAYGGPATVAEGKALYHTARERCADLNDDHCFFCLGYAEVAHHAAPCDSTIVAWTCYGHADALETARDAEQCLSFADVDRAVLASKAAG